jgi:hypothetical protein
MFIPPKNFSPKVTALIAFMVFLAFIVGLSISPMRNYFAKKDLQGVNAILNSSNENKTINQCETILNFDKTKALKNDYFNGVLFDKVFKQCDENYNFAYVETSEENCSWIIREPKSYFKRSFVKYD